MGALLDFEAESKFGECCVQCLGPQLAMVRVGLPWGGLCVGCADQDRRTLYCTDMNMYQCRHVENSF